MKSVGVNAEDAYVFITLSLLLLKIPAGRAHPEPNAPGKLERARGAREEFLYFYCCAQREQIK
jgi:hypothetical protein